MSSKDVLSEKPSLFYLYIKILFSLTFFIDTFVQKLTDDYAFRKKVSLKYCFRQDLHNTRKFSKEHGNFEHQLLQPFYIFTTIAGPYLSSKLFAAFTGYIVEIMERCAK
jgi:hypothetical protein